MKNQPHSARNPNLPIDAAAAKSTKDGLPEKEDELKKSEAEKEAETAPEDHEPFNVDKVDDLEKAKKENK